MFNFLEHVTVEPSYFIYVLLFNWIEEFNANLYLQKSCRYNTTIEPDLNTKCDDEKAGVLFISEVTSKYGFPAALLATFVTIFGTTWSDKAGRRRRPLIHMTNFGQLFVSMSGCLHSYFWHWTPSAAAVSSAIFYSLSGGYYLMTVACLVYLCEGDVEYRTMKVGFIGAIQAVCMILGRGGSGIILRRVGFFYSYLLCLILAITSSTLGLIFIKDNSVPAEKTFRFYQIFNVKLILLDNFKVVFNKNLRQCKKVMVSLLLLAYVAVCFTIYGEVSVLYPYLRYRFGLDEEKYSIFSFYRYSMSTLGALFCSAILSKCLKIHDGLIGILAGSFDLLSITVLLFATQVWQIFTIPLLDLFHGFVIVIPISFLSKYYNASELGRLQAVNGVFALLFPFTFPIYNFIFQATLDVFPSAFCLLSVFVDLVIIICFCVSYVLSKKIDREKPRSVEEETHRMMLAV